MSALFRKAGKRDVVLRNFNSCTCPHRPLVVDYERRDTGFSLQQFRTRRMPSGDVSLHF